MGVSGKLSLKPRPSSRVPRHFVPRAAHDRVGAKAAAGKRAKRVSFRADLSGKKSFKNRHKNWMVRKFFRLVS